MGNLSHSNILLDAQLLLLCHIPSSAELGTRSSAANQLGQASYRIRGVGPQNVHLANKDRTADGHGESDQREVDTGKIHAPNVDAKSSKIVPPPEAS